jgi:hypothetical protein
MIDWIRMNSPSMWQPKPLFLIRSWCNFLEAKGWWELGGITRNTEADTNTNVQTPRGMHAERAPPTCSRSSMVSNPSTHRISRVTQTVKLGISNTCPQGTNKHISHARAARVKVASRRRGRRKNGLPAALGKRLGGGMC